MNFDDYKGKYATIKSTDTLGVIIEVRFKRDGDNRLGARFDVQDPAGKIHELMPHEIKVHEDH